MKKLISLLCFTIFMVMQINAQHKYMFRQTTVNDNQTEFYRDASHTELIGVIDPGENARKCFFEYTTTSRISTVYAIFYNVNGTPNDRQYNFELNSTFFLFCDETSHGGGCIDIYWQPSVSVSNPPVSSHIPYNESIGFLASTSYTGNIEWRIYNSNNEYKVYAAETGKNLTITLEDIRENIEDFDTDFPLEEGFRVSAVVPGFTYDISSTCPIIQYEENESSLTNTYYFDLADLSVVGNTPGSENEICDDEITLKTTAVDVTSFDWYYGQADINGNLQGNWEIIRNNSGSQVTIGVTELDIDSSRTVIFKVHKHGVDYPATVNHGGFFFYPPAPDFSIREIHESCIEEENGKIGIYIEPHTTSQRYQITNNEGHSGIVEINTSQNFIYFNNLPASGTYKIEGFNIIGGTYPAPVCYSEQHPIEVSTLNKPLVSNTVVTDPHCTDWDDGSVQITGANQNGTIDTYYLLDNNFIPVKNSASSTITDIAEGNYKVFFEDTRSCNSDTIDISLDDPEPITFVTDSVLPLCFGSSDGEIFVLNAQGGAHTNYAYSILPATGSFVGTTFSDLPSGTYQVKVSLDDYTECYDTHTVILEDPPELTMNTQPVTLTEIYGSGYHLTCSGGNDGEAELHATGGTGDYTYHLRGPVNLDHSDAVFSGLSAQTYQGFVSDEHNCLSDTTGFTLLEPDPIQLGSVSYTKESCRNTGDGVIDITLTGGVSPYNYYWNLPGGGWQTNEDVYDAVTGTYSVDITDYLGCEQTLSGMYLEPPDTIEAVISSLPPVCRGKSSGTISIESVTNGLSPYSYVIENGIPEVISVLPVIDGDYSAGTYLLTIRDNNYIEGDEFFENCKSQFSVTINEKAPIILNTTTNNAPCYGDNGSISIDNVNGPGNTANYVFAWYDNLSYYISEGQTLNNQPAGDYYIKITDEENCDTSIYFTISQPPVLTFNPATVNDASCKEVHNGSIEIHGAGGSPPYQYNLNGTGGYGSSSVFNNLSDGEYVVNIMDNNLCLHDTTVSVDAREVTVSVYNMDNVSCYGFNDGQLILQADGGNGNYAYSTDNGYSYQSNATISDLYAGTYSVKARDNETTCESDPLEQEITEPEPLVLSPQLIDSAACGLPLGEIDYETSGGSGEYEILWTLNNTIITSLENLVSGDYEGTLRDIHSTEACTTVAVIHVPDRPAPEITGHEVLSQSWCNKPLGEVSVDVVSGSPAYSFSWDDADQQTGRTATGLTAGEYHVNVTDRFGCTDVYSFILEDGPPIVINHTVEDATCNQNNGNIYLSVYGGIKPYLFKWHDSLNVNPVYDSSMLNLYSGIYDLTVSDDIGCEQPYTVEISNLDGPEINHMLIHKSWCGLEEGYAAMSASGGELPYSYQWIPQGTSQSISSETWADKLGAGIYYARVIDATGCVDIMPVEITDSTELEPDLILVNLDSSSCGQSTGSIEVLMSEGLEPYNYLWDVQGINNLAVLSDIPEGLYRVTASDTRGCIKELEIEITDKALPELTISNIISAYCGNPDGQIHMKGSKGSPPYYTILSNSPDSYVLEWTDSLNAYSGIADSLLPSIYSITLYDNEGCTSVDATVQVANFSPMDMTVLSVIPVSCYGGTDGSIQVEASQGMAPYTYHWSINNTDSSENSTLPAGEVQVTATDTEGCEVSETIQINQPDQLEISYSQVTNPACHDMCNGSIEVVGTGGTGLKKFIWNNTDTAQHITGLCPGNHSMVMIDENACKEPFSFILANPPVLRGVDLPEEEIICSGSVYMINLDGQWQYVVWTSDNGYSNTGNHAELSEEGTYYVEAESDNGCPVSDTMVLFLADDLLTADFLMASEAYEGEEVVLIDISWPIPDEISWTFPEELNKKQGNSFSEEIVFEEAGTYEITLSASLGDCYSSIQRTIEILDVIPGQNNKSADDPHKFIKSFDLYPNPVDDEFYIDIELEQETEVWIEILGSNGQYFRKKAEGTFEENMKTNINISDYKPGIYIVRIIAGDEAQNKIIVVR